MKRVKILFSLIAFMSIIVSCNKEEASSADGFGFISFRNIGVDQNVVSTIPASRAGETDKDAADNDDDAQDGNGGESEADDTVAEVAKKGFELSVVSYGETVYACSDYEKFLKGECENVELRAGKYTVVAGLGNPDNEGFEEPYYSGSQEINLKRGENVGVDLECKLANSILKITYTNNFKKYFSTYSSYVASSKGNTVEYAQDEARGAYLVSGEVNVYVKAKKSGANEATLNVGKYTMKPQYEYALELDVDAASAVMTVTFSENIKEEPITINVSDAALNANPPYMVGEGFGSGDALELVEGSTLPERPRITINAEAEIKSCVMTTTSDYLIEKGWSGSVDLASADEQALTAIKNSGVELKGFTGSLGKMAYVDFSGLVSTLPKGNPIEVKLIVTDKFGKTSDEFLFNVETKDCMFSVSPTAEEAPFLGNECKVNVTLLEGDVKNVKFALTDGGQTLDIEEVSEPTLVNGLNQYTLTLKGGDEVKFINPFKVNAKYLAYDKDTETNLKVAYGIMLDDDECDVWAKRAYLHVYNDDMQNLKVQKKEANGNWTDLQNTEISGTDIIAKGLASNTQQQLRVVKVGKEPTNEVDIKTEEELQVPNSGFEQWYSKALYSQSVLWAKNTIYGFYFWKEGESDYWWDTTNTLTTPDPGGSSVWDYRSASGVVPTSYEAETASYHLRKYDGQSGLSTNAHSGTTAAEIATVGWGAGDTWTSTSSQPSNRTAGQLYIGSYGNRIKYGKSFLSRPTSVVFYYKYYSYNNETTAPFVSLYDENGNIIGEGNLKISSSVNSYTRGEIRIKYTKENVKAKKIVISFMSTDSDSPSTKAVKGGSSALSGYLDSRHVGSILTVDDVQLIYE